MEHTHAGRFRWVLWFFAGIALPGAGLLPDLEMGSLRAETAVSATEVPAVLRGFEGEVFGKAVRKGADRIVIDVTILTRTKGGGESEELGKVLRQPLTVKLTSQVMQQSKDVLRRLPNGGRIRVQIQHVGNDPFLTARSLEWFRPDRPDCRPVEGSDMFAVTESPAPSAGNKSSGAERKVPKAGGAEAGKGDAAPKQGK